MANGGDRKKAVLEAADTFGCDISEWFKESEKPQVRFSEPIGGRNVIDPPQACEATPESVWRVDSPPTLAHLKTLQQHFGCQTFLPLQWRIIYAVLTRKKDQCVIMSAGYDRRLCYLFPAVHLKKTVLVVTPFNSSIDDQVLDLNVNDIPACFLDPERKEMPELKNGLLKGKFRIVYMTPQTLLSNSQFLTLLNKQAGICLVVVDEAHRASHRSNGFQSDFKRIESVRSCLPNVPFMALTTTATSQIKNDIISALNMKNAIITCTGFDPINVYFDFVQKSTSILKDLKRFLKVENDDRYYFDVPTIVYCPTTTLTVAINNILLALGVRSSAYHSEMSTMERQKSHNKFVNDQIEVIVASSLSDLGIDKPNVRQVIHYGAPNDIELFYRQMGRAGRDGLSSACRLVCNKGDFQFYRRFLTDVKSKKYRLIREEKLCALERFVTTTACRRRILLNYFEGKSIKIHADVNSCCDICSKRLRLMSNVTKKDYGVEALQLMDAIKLTEGEHGLSIPIFVLRGSDNEFVSDHCKTDKTFGGGKLYSEQWWSSLGQLLLKDNYLTRTTCDSRVNGCMVRRETIRLSPEGRYWYTICQSKGVAMPLLLSDRFESDENSHLAFASKDFLTGREMNRLMKQTERNRNSNDPFNAQMDQDELNAHLLDIRNKMAVELKLATYMIFDDKVMSTLARLRPTTRDDLKQIDGVSQVKVEKFGDKFLAFIKKNPFEHLVAANIDQLESKSFLTPTQQESYEMVESDGQNIKEVAVKRKSAVSTIINHLCTAIEIGFPVNVKRLGVTSMIFGLIVDRIKSPPINNDLTCSLEKIKAQFADNISYEQIKVVIALLKREINAKSQPKEEIGWTSSSENAVADCSKSIGQSSIKNTSPVAGCSKSVGQSSMQKPIAVAGCSKSIRQSSIKNTSPVAGCSKSIGQSSMQKPIAVAGCSKSIEKSSMKNPIAVAGCSKSNGQSAKRKIRNVDDISQSNVQKIRKVNSRRGKP